MEHALQAGGGEPAERVGQHDRRLRCLFHDVLDGLGVALQGPARQVGHRDVDTVAS